MTDTDTVTYEFTTGRVGQHSNVAPLTVPRDGRQEQALIDYITLLMTTPGAVVEVGGHPDALHRSVYVRHPDTPEFERDRVAQVATYINDPTCNGKHDLPK